MFIDHLLNQGNGPLLEQMVKFTQARHAMIADSVVNVSTPNYLQKDLSVEAFQARLRQRVDERSRSAPGKVRFDDINRDIENPNDNILFHDRNNRSIEQLMSNQAQNALMHNLMTELLRKQFSSIQNALKERVS